MAYRAKPSDMLKDNRAKGRSIGRLQTRRLLNSHAPNLAFALQGPLSVDSKFPWLWVALDPGGQGDYLEYKHIIGFEGKIDSGAVEVSWYADDLVIAGSEGHVIDSANTSNRLNLDVDMPYIFSNSADGGEWLRPVFTTVSGTADDVMLSCVPIFETVPV